jgi:hypothetical protein
MPRVQMVAAALAVITLVGVGAVVLLDQTKPEPPPRQVAGYTPTFQPPPANSPPVVNNSAPVQQGGTAPSSPADRKPLIEAAGHGEAEGQSRRAPAPPPKVVYFQKQDLTWPEVEERFEKLREARQSDPSKVHDLLTLYASVADPAFVGAEDYPTLCAELGAWRDALPESPTPLVALADAHIRWAWEARGSGPALTVSEEGWKLFHTRLDEARRMSERAIELGARDGQPFRCLITVGMAESATKEELRELLDAGRKIDPLYVGMYEQMAIALMPRWGGDPGDVERFANEVATLVPGDDGLELFGLIAYQIHQYECNDPVTILWGQYDRKLLARSADVLAQRYPKSQGLVQFTAYMAMVTQDHEVARRIRPLVSEFQREHKVFPWANTLQGFLRWAAAPDLPRKEEAFVWPGLLSSVGLSFDRDSRGLWIGQPRGGRSAILLDHSSGQLESSLLHPGGSLDSVTFSAEQRIAVIAVREGPFVGLVVINLDAPLIPTIVRTKNSPVRVSLHPHERLVVWGEFVTPKTPEWRLLDLTSDSLEPLELPLAEVTALNFLPDGKHLAVTSHKGCGLLDAKTGREILRLPVRTATADPAFIVRSIHDVDEQGGILASGEVASTRTKGLARCGSDGQVVQLLVKDVARHNPLVLSPDRRYLAAGVSAGPARGPHAIHVYRIRDGQQAARFDGHHDHIGELAFSPDGQKLASMSRMTDVVKVWSLAGLHEKHSPPNSPAK